MALSYTYRTTFVFIRDVQKGEQSIAIYGVKYVAVASLGITLYSKQQTSENKLFTKSWKWLFSHLLDRKLSTFSRVRFPYPSWPYP